MATNNSKSTDPKSDKQNEAEWGYDMYPERRKPQFKGIKESISKIMSNRKTADHPDRLRCERNVYKCIKQSPIVRLMIGALNASGCPIDIRRHISCEECSTSVTGGYDSELNQIVVCLNTGNKEGIVQGVLTHEMIHMFDYCRNNLDFKNLDHLACTEIRAANLAHCSFLSAWFNGDTSIFNFRDTHKQCVKIKALGSVVAARNVTLDEAQRAIDRVFDKCYNDLEPFGRRVRRNSEDMSRAYKDSFYYGYNDGGS